MTLENDDLEGLAREIRRVIESNKAFLDGVEDEEFEVEDAQESEDDDADLEEL